MTCTTYGPGKLDIIWQPEALDWGSADTIEPPYCVPREAVKDRLKGFERVQELTVRFGSRASRFAGYRPNHGSRATPRNAREYRQFMLGSLLEESAGISLRALLDSMAGWRKCRDGAWLVAGCGTRNITAL